MTDSNSSTFVVEVPAGVLIRDPGDGRIVKSGDELPRNSFWRRRLDQGEVRERTAAPAPKQPGHKE